LQLNQSYDVRLQESKAVKRVARSLCTINQELYYQTFKRMRIHTVNTLAERDVLAPGMPNSRIKIAEDGNGEKPADAGKVGHP
jgi:hypothetical protein